MTEPLLDIDGLTIVFPGGRGQLPWQRRPDVRAVQGASLTVGVGETVGLVGESGSGKTTLGRAVLRFLTPVEGSIRLGGFDVTSFGRVVPPAYRNAVQVVFQDPVGSLNPSMVVADIVGEPLMLHEGLKGEARRARAAELLEQVGLRAEHLDRYPHEFSGGQRQRIAIARALATSPDLIVLDEPVSALDVSTQSQVINLLEQLQRDTGAAYLFIAHDLAVVRHACERIVVMYHSRIVETAPADAICEQPTHPYTELLLASIPDPDPDVQRRKSEHRRALTRGVTGAIGAAPTDSCPFADRCPHVMDICRESFPDEVATMTGGTVACHLHTSGPRLGGRPLAELSGDEPVTSTRRPAEKEATT